MVKFPLFLLFLSLSFGQQVYWPFDYFGYGYDILTDQPTAPVVQLTMKEGRTWTSLVTGLTYSLPDQVEIMDYSASSLTKAVDIIRNLTEYQQTVESWHNFGISFFGAFGFQFSHEAEDVKKMLLDGKDVLFIASKQFEFFEIASWTFSSLNQSGSEFNRRINSLPTTYISSTDRKAYRDWIDLFGTSYFDKAHYGGDIKYYIQVESVLLQEESEEWVSYQVGMFVTYMDIQFGFDFGRNISRDNISEKFWQHSKASCRFRPFGDTLQDCDNLTNIGFTNWIQAAQQQPVLLAPILRNISDLFVNPIKRQNIEQAVVGYLNNPNATDIDYLEKKPVPQAPLLSMASPVKRKQAIPLIPGYDIIGMGLDASTMELSVLPIVQLETVENETYSCTTDDQYGPGCWQNPFYPDANYFIPWNVYLENTPKSTLVNGSQIFQSYDDFQQYYSHTTSHHSFFGSKSKSVYHFYEKYFEEDSALTFVYQSRSWYKLTLPPLPPPQLHPRVSTVINQLPAKYDPSDPNNLRMYRNAIGSLGTHFIYTAMFGGVQQMIAWFHKCMLSTYSVDWVKEQSGWSFFGIISDDSGRINYNSKLNVNYVSWSSVEVDYTGGKAFQYEPSDFNDWVVTLKDRPVPTSYDVIPISMLIEDPSLSASYAAAVDDYMKESYGITVQTQGTFSQRDPWTKPSWCKWSNSTVQY